MRLAVSILVVVFVGRAFVVIASVFFEYGEDGIVRFPFVGGHGERDLDLPDCDALAERTGLFEGFVEALEDMEPTEAFFVRKN